jgi:DNA primase (bacterial type)
MNQQKNSRPAQAAYRNVTNHDKPVNKVLQSLDSVKKTAPDRWMAKCPAHNDRRPSLSIRETEDGKVLLKCWSGCGAAEIVNALGLSLADLFPGDRRSLHQHGREPMRHPFDHKTALRGIAHEAAVARLIVAAANRGDELDADSLDRLALAEVRISDALLAAGGAQ